MATSNPLVTQTQAETMSSVDLVDVINEVRKLNGKRRLQHDDFVKKIESHPGIDHRKFFRHVPCLVGNGATRMEKCYFLPRRECDLLLMSESLLIQAQVYDRLTDVMQSAQLTAQALQRIEADYAENLKHHPNYKLGEALKDAIRMEDYDNAAEIEKMLDGLDFEPAARTQGLPVTVIRRKVAAHTVATLMLCQLHRGEHRHESKVKDVVGWARATVQEDDARARRLAYEKAQAKVPMTLEQIDAYDLIHKHDK